MVENQPSEQPVHRSDTVTIPVWLYDRMARVYYAGSARPPSDPDPVPGGEVEARPVAAVFDASMFEGLMDVPPGWKPIGVNSPRVPGGEVARGEKG